MELIDDAGNPPNLYVHLDTYHMNIEESSSEHAVGVCGDKLGYALHSTPTPPLPSPSPFYIACPWRSKRHFLLMDCHSTTQHAHLTFMPDCCDEAKLALHVTTSSSSTGSNNIVTVVVTQHCFCYE